MYSQTSDVDVTQLSRKSSKRKNWKKIMNSRLFLKYYFNLICILFLAISDPGQTPNETRATQFDSNVSSIDSNFSFSSASSGFNYRENCFLPSVISIFIFGFLLHIACSQYSTSILSCLVATFIGLMMWEWVDLYGANISRNEVIYKFIIQHVFFYKNNSFVKINLLLVFYFNQKKL